MTYNDWFLPSLTELSVMYSFADLINQVSQAHGGRAMDMVAAYWSSREPQGNPYYAWYLNFSLGVPYLNNKDSTYAVRCVRAF